MDYQDCHWVQISPVEALKRLWRAFPTMMEDASSYTAAVRSAAAAGVYYGPPAGTVFSALPEVADGKSLAVVLQFDALSVAKNGLGAAAASTKKFYVLCMRVVNVPYLLRKKTPLMVIPKKTVDTIGLSAIFGSWQSHFVALAEGLPIDVVFLVHVLLLLHVVIC